MELKLISLAGSRDYASAISAKIGIPLVQTDEFSFDDGEWFVSPKENIRGADVFVIQSLYGCKGESLHEKLIKALIMCGACWDASAGRITLVTPYFCYGRQDRKTKPRAPITTKYMANMIRSVFVSRLLALNVHNPAVEQNVFNEIRCDLLEARPLFVEYLLNHFPDRSIALLAPDDGSMELVSDIYPALQKHGVNVEVAGCMYKTHHGTVITGHDVMGVVEGRDVVVIDDMISSGKTVAECARACKRRGANRILAVCAAHGLFVGDADKNLSDPFIERVVVTDSVLPFRLKSPEVQHKLVVLPTTALFAEAVVRIHRHQSVTDLFDFKG